MKCYGQAPGQKAACQSHQAPHKEQRVEQSEGGDESLDGYMALWFHEDGVQLSGQLWHQQSDIRDEMSAALALLSQARQ